MRIVIIVTSVLLLLTGCGVKTVQQPPPVTAEIVRKADWEVEFRDVFFLDAKHGWVIGEKGTILYTEDGGKNWKTQKSGTEARLNKMQFMDEKRGWVVGNEGTFLQTGNGGKKWEKRIVRDGSMSLISLHFLDEQRGWIVGEGGLILHTKDRRETWVIEESGTSEDLYHVAYVEGLGIVVLGTHGTILKRKLDAES